MDRRDLAAIVGCCHSTVSKWVREGKLPAPPFKQTHVETAKQLLIDGAKIRNSGLISKPRIDPDSTTQPITVKLLPDDAQWIKSLPGGASKHIRQAVQNYRKQISN